MKLGWLLDPLPPRPGAFLADASIAAYRWTLEKGVSLPGQEQTLGRASVSLTTRFQKVLRLAFGATMIFDPEDLYLAIAGFWEPNLTYEVVRTLRPGDTFVDVGANSGYYTLLASRLVGRTGRVVAIEGSPATFRRLEQNVARNGLTNVRCVQRAVMDRVGEVEFATQVAGASMKASAVHRDATSSIIRVPCAPLDSLLLAEEIATLRMLKIDVEGAEPQVFAGAHRILREAPRDLVIACEASPGWSGVSSAEQVLAVPLAEGFEALHLANDYAMAGYLPNAPLSPPRHATPLPSGQIDCILARPTAGRTQENRLSTVADLYRELQKFDR